MNYYEILEVSVNASKEVIKNAYRALTKKYHPDSYKGNQEYAQEKMKEINEAYETLMDDNKRLMYDYENGFKIDPNAPKNEIDLKEEDIKVEEKENKEDKLMTFIKEKKVFIVVGVIILFIIAFIIGIMIAGGGDSDKKDTEDEIVVNNEDTKVEDENTTNNTLIQSFQKNLMSNYSTNLYLMAFFSPGTPIYFVTAPRILTLLPITSVLFLRFNAYLTSA